MTGKYLLIICEHQECRTSGILKDPNNPYTITNITSRRMKEDYGDLA
jgi:hypothetical protein